MKIKLLACRGVNQSEKVKQLNKQTERNERNES